ncbi:hypothetical protein DPMN_024293 [Dreissena polymorpha]|uniref:GRF-type domain-containing protein n=2 Tax=Dreissena polymorpha TaxID=45954 RepID=A0A9D4LNV3_DREPO|nr:hypothetical protein DPMN_024293 [Dreissena polymorpha]
MQEPVKPVQTLAHNTGGCISSKPSTNKCYQKSNISNKVPSPLCNKSRGCNVGFDVKSCVNVSRTTPGKMAHQTVASCTKELVGNPEEIYVSLKDETCAPISKKRKEFTPVKTAGKTNSPLRKTCRMISPAKKCNSFDVYVDPVPCESSVTSVSIDVGPQSNAASCKGLYELDLNMTNSKVLNSTNSSPMGPKSQFKVPQLVAPLKCNTSSKRLSFTTSTPVCSSKSVPVFNSAKQVSPVTRDPNANSLKFVTKTYVPNEHSRNKPTSSISGMAKTPVPSQSATFKVPNSLCSRSVSMNSLTNISNNTSNTSLKMTPPLCQCGRRSKRRMVQSPGQNMGRFFFSCAVKKGVGSKDGCQFFKWETLSNSVIPNFTNRSSNISKQFTPVVGKSLTAVSSYDSVDQRKSLGVCANTSRKVYLRQ